MKTRRQTDLLRGIFCFVGFQNIKHTNSNVRMKVILALFALMASASAFTPTSRTQPVRCSVQMSAHTNSRRQFLGTSAAMATAATTLIPTPPAAYAKGNSVSFSNVNDGDTVPRTFAYQFQVAGYKLAPAKDGLEKKSGHHHLVIDSGSFVAKGEVIPFDANHKHYGKAQTEGVLELEPGQHQITLQFANANHESFGKELAQSITVTVKD